ncbi:hypothetical protein H1O16_gp371 [Burkholderia phage BcepSaruman]|uniref:Uncharacterized protein n=1 Tax=Burkholderia phage BcepSaruman TaxID=2530032 RepID=A0A4D5ZCU7_9CAUD|nr:hypothetical protein H1O16_gp371 [Burkholderia phage BcepSaruman]QBX06784.1 hypothetical protein BcepSaruman_371 [Burkholderia phage BcepSaruman]
MISATELRALYCDPVAATLGRVERALVQNLDKALDRNKGATPPRTSVFVDASLSDDELERVRTVIVANGFGFAVDLSYGNALLRRIIVTWQARARRRVPDQQTVTISETIVHDRSGARQA